MAKWKHRTARHMRIGEILFQLNVPLDHHIPEFEIVAMKNGTVVDRATFWDSVDDFRSSAQLMYNNWVEKQNPVVDDSDMVDEGWASYHYR